MPSKTHGPTPGISGTAADDLLHVDNNGGTIAAYDSGSVVELSNVGIGGGTLATSNPEGDSGGVIEIVTPALGDTNITYFNGSSEGTLTVDGFVQVDAAPISSSSARSTIRERLMSISASRVPIW